MSKDYEQLYKSVILEKLEDITCDCMGCRNKVKALKMILVELALEENKK